MQGVRKQVSQGMEKEMASEGNGTWGTSTVRWRCVLCNTFNEGHVPKCLKCNSHIVGGSDSGGVKLDQGKHQVGLISKIFLFGLASVLTFGAKKYAAHNWREGIAYSRLFDAMMRHMWAWWAGEENDPESGQSHLDHAACCLMFLRELSETRKDLDDRYSEMRIVPVPEGRQDG